MNMKFGSKRDRTRRPAVPAVIKGRVGVVEIETPMGAGRWRSVGAVDASGKLVVLEYSEKKVVGEPTFFSAGYRDPTE